MTREEAAERALIHSSEDWASYYRNLITTPTPPTDDQPQEVSTEGEVSTQRDPEGEEGSEAEDEVTG